MRERRFIRFASVEYHAQIYMTPQDFLESVIEADPRRNKYIFFKFEFYYVHYLKNMLLQPD